MYKILIADDEELERKSLHIFFSRNFSDVMLLPDAVNGAEVVETALHQKPDILILDIEMPGLNGLEALKIIRQTNHFIHVIIKTAYSKFDYAQEALNLHADFFLLKPVKKDELKSCIKQIIAQIKQEAGKVESTFSQNSSISKIALLSSILHSWTNDADICRYAENLNINFQSGFMLLMAFPNLDSLRKSSVIKFLEQKMPVVTDFVLGAFENEILPVMCYSDIPSASKEKDKSELGRILSSWITGEFHVTPVIYSGKTVSNIIELRASWLDALKQLGKQPSFHTPELPENDTLKKVLDYIHQHYYEDISLERLAEYVKINPSYLSHLFRAKLNRNYTDYLNEYRIGQAVRLMQEGITGTQELALRVGYTYPSYFCRLFKKYTGYTIGDFKKEL